MLYPLLHLHQNVNSDRPSVDFYCQPAVIESVKALEEGGAMVCFNGPDGGYARVNESPDMIAKMINETIIGQSQMATVGSIRAQLRANEELQKKASGIAIPRLSGG